MKIKINNMPKNAIDNKHWKNPGASLYNELCDASNWEELLKEAYLVAPISKITNDGRMKTPFSRSGCKYPHHVVHNGYLVLSKSGVRAAYCRLKQMGQYHGEAKTHIDSHLKELGMMNKDGEYYEDTIQNNFFNIEMYLQEKTGYPFIEDFMPDEYFEEKSNGKLKYDYRKALDAKTKNPLLLIYTLDGIKITNPGNGWYKMWGNNALNIDDKNKAISKAEHDIFYKGNTDHQSYNQMLVAVKDLKTGDQWTIHKNKGKVFTTVGIFEKSVKFTIKIGDIETKENATWKSTYNFTGSSRDPFGLRKMTTTEKMFQSGRGAKMSDIEDYHSKNTAKNNPPIHTGSNIPLYKHPSKSEMNNYISTYICKYLLQSISSYINSDKSSIDYFVNDVIENLTATGYQSDKKDAWNATKNKIFKDRPITELDFKKIIDGLNYTIKTNSYDKYRTIPFLFSGNDDNENKKIAEGAIEIINKIIIEGKKRNSFHNRLNINESSDYLEEKSHGKLKFEFRFVIGEDNGHLYKIVYELNPENITKDNFSGGEARDTLAKEIRKTGNSNYQSKGNKVIAIIDMCNNKRVNKISAYPVIHNLGGNIMPVKFNNYIDIMSQFYDDQKLEKLKKELQEECPTGICPNPGFKHAIKKSKEKGQNPIMYIVGEIDNTETYKTTDINAVLKGMLGLESTQLFENEITQYDPPYNADEVIEKYGMDVYNRLAQDPAHKFRMDTGIELIHEEPSLEELNRIHNNWQLMSNQQKEISDKKSIELFGINNEDHYIQLLSKYNNSSNYSIEKINNEYQLISDNGEWISRLKYFIYDDIPNFDWINIADVDTNEKYRHQGYMTILLNELINDMHAQYPTMGLYLLVRAENIPAIKLYEKLGFKILKMQASDNGEFYVMYLGNADINQLKNTNFMTGTSDHLEEAYTLNNLPDTMYFASPDKMNKLNGNQLFMTPYKGIASLFIASRIAKNNFKEYIKSNFKNSISAEYNLSYEEWWANDNSLIQPLRMAHISHNIKDISDTINGTASGYIYTIDISKIKDHLKLFKHTKDANREVIYSGEDIIPTNIEPWTMKWELKYDPENESHSFPGKIIYSNIQESMNWIESFVHDEEFRNNQSSSEYDKIIDFHENVGAIVNIQSPGSLNSWMHNITIAYASKNDNFYHDPSKDTNFNPNKSAALQPPKDIARSKKGSVFDKVELERFWFDKHGYKYATLCILLQDGSKFIAHPFIVYQDGSAICWFENSLKGIDGSRRFGKLNDLIHTVIKTVKKEYETNTMRIGVYFLQDPPKYGINNNQYIRYVQSQIELPLNDLPTRLFDESTEYFDEKSHGKLQYDFREVIDYDTGHSLQIVYSLKDIKITHLGVAHDFDDSKIPEVEKNIAKKGNVDHQSTGQEILAIIDRVTGKRLTSARTIGPYDPILKMGFKNDNNWEELSLTPENLKKLHDDCQAKGSEFMKQHIHTLTVGEIDNSATFKSTKWYSNNVGLLMNGQVVTAKSKKDKKEFIDAVRNGEHPELKLGLYNRNNAIRTAGEAIGTGRGAKMNDLNPGAWDSPPFNHPSKKDWKKFNANESTDMFIEAEETQEESVEHYDEASHRKLQYDFRMGWDYDTGHMIKVVYSLDGIKIDDVGDFYYSTHNVSHDDHLDYTRKNIAKKGNTDHRSHGQKVLAIVDCVTKKKLTQVKLIGPHCEGIHGRNTIQDPEDLKIARQYIQSHPEFCNLLKVGEIDNSSTFKSTAWASNVIDPETGENLRWRKIAKAEMERDGRGHKINNINAKDYHVFNNDTRFMIYHNPSKKQALQELYMREKDILNYLREFTKREDPNDPTAQKRYQGEINNLRIIQRDIETIQNGKYDLSIMKKYRNAYPEQFAVGTERGNTNMIINRDYDDYQIAFKSIGERDHSLNESYYQEADNEESMPKKTDKAESDKNGVNRKKLYIAFIEWCKTFNDKNAFGSMFDKDAFHVTYPFVPESMRYFYRLANPLMCVLSGNLTFFQLSELRKVNAKNSQLANMMIFAATENDMRVLNVKDGAVYMATDENGVVKLGTKLADTFDLYIQTMIDRGDILNGADPNKVPDAPPEIESDEDDTKNDNETEEDIMDEPIEDTQEDNPESSEEPPALEDTDATSAE